MNGQQQSAVQTYWKKNLRLIAFCLSIWFVVSFGFGVLLVEQLNRFSVFGFKLGFWFAQQGSIYTFVILVFYYARKMNQLDRQYGVEEDGS
jgi:putative solute:sodium symporter small subunit